MNMSSVSFEGPIAELEDAPEAAMIAAEDQGAGAVAINGMSGIQPPIVACLARSFTRTTPTC